MTGVSSFPIGAEICRAFGLDPSRCRDVHIHLPLNGAITVEAEMYAEVSVEKMPVTELRKFKLVPVDEPAIYSEDEFEKRVVEIIQRLKRRGSWPDFTRMRSADGFREQPLDVTGIGIHSDKGKISL